jgi:NOL1/NOP2/fmu family ribosome biogenesis protein
MKPLTSTDKKRIIEKLNEQYGITDLPYLVILFGKEKLRLYSGILSKEELYHLDNNARIETIGLYFAKYEEESNIRLTIDGLQLLKDQITKNIYELDDNEADNWLKGNDLDIKTDYGWKVLKNNGEFIGCGKSTGEKISNFMPKERRIK